MPFAISSLVRIVFRVLGQFALVAAFSASSFAGPAHLFGKAHPLSQGSSPLVPVAVFGADDRQPLSSNEAALNDKIGVIASRGSNICTAFCIAPDTIATASHCLFGTEQSRAPNLTKLSFRIGAGKTAGVSPLAGDGPEGIKRNIVSGTEQLRITPPIDAANDWAIARIEKPVCRAGGIPLAPAPREAVERESKEGKVYQVAMHRDVSPETLVRGKPCRIERAFPGAPAVTIARDFSASDDILLHVCDTGPGSSGSPLLIDGPNGPEVVGINVGTYILSRMSTKTSNGETEEISAAIANTAVATRRFKSAADAFAVTTSALAPKGPLRSAPKPSIPRREAL